MPFSPGDLWALTSFWHSTLPQREEQGKVLFCLFVQSEERISCSGKKMGKIVSSSFREEEDEAECFPSQSAVLVHQGSDWLLLFKDVSLCVIDSPNSRSRCGPFGWSQTPTPPTPDYTSLISHYVPFRLERSMDLKQWMKVGTTDMHLSPWLWRARP